MAKFEVISLQQKTKAPLLSIIIPFYNEEKYVGGILAEILDSKFPFSYELVVVNDGSRDSSAEIVKKFEKKSSAVRLIDFKSNNGKGFAIRKGIEFARGKYIVIQDSDGEYPPRQIPSVVKPLLSGKARAVLGSRFTGNNKLNFTPNFFGNLGLTNCANLLWGARLTDIETCYKGLSREDALALGLKHNDFEVEAEWISKILKKKWGVTEVPVVYKPRNKKQGKKISWKHGFTSLAWMLYYRFGGLNGF